MSAWILSLEPEASQNRLDHRGMNLADHVGSVQRSSCLWLQLFRVERVLLLPKCQSNSRDLTCQRQTCHLGRHSLRQQSHIEVAQRPHSTAGSTSGSLPDRLHHLAVITIHTATLSWA